MLTVAGYASFAAVTGVFVWAFASPIFFPFVGAFSIISWFSAVSYKSAVHKTKALAKLLVSAVIGFLMYTTYCVIYEFSNDRPAAMKKLNSSISVSSGLLRGLKTVLDPFLPAGFTRNVQIVRDLLGSVREFCGGLIGLHNSSAKVPPSKKSTATGPFKRLYYRLRYLFGIRRTCHPLNLPSPGKYTGKTEYIDMKEGEPYTYNTPTEILDMARVANKGSLRQAEKASLVVHYAFLAEHYGVAAGVELPEPLYEAVGKVSDPEKWREATRIAYKFPRRKNVKEITPEYTKALKQLYLRAFMAFTAFNKCPVVDGPKKEKKPLEEEEEPLVDDEDTVPAVDYEKVIANFGDKAAELMSEPQSFGDGGARFISKWLFYDFVEDTYLTYGLAGALAIATAACVYLIKRCCASPKVIPEATSSATKDLAQAITTGPSPVDPPPSPKAGPKERLSEFMKMATEHPSFVSEAKVTPTRKKRVAVLKKIRKGRGKRVPRKFNNYTLSKYAGKQLLIWKTAGAAHIKAARRGVMPSMYVVSAHVMYSIDNPGHVSLAKGEKELALRFINDRLKFEDQDGREMKFEDTDTHEFAEMLDEAMHEYETYIPRHDESRIYESLMTGSERIKIFGKSLNLRPMLLSRPYSDGRKQWPAKTVFGRAILSDTLVIFPTHVANLEGQCPPLYIEVTPQITLYIDLTSEKKMWAVKKVGDKEAELPLNSVCSTHPDCTCITIKMASLPKAQLCKPTEDEPVVTAIAHTGVISSQGHIATIRQNEFFHTCSTVKGDSGCAIIGAGGLVGMHIAGSAINIAVNLSEISSIQKYFRLAQ